MEVNGNQTVWLFRWQNLNFLVNYSFNFIFSSSNVIIFLNVKIPKTPEAYLQVSITF